MAQGETIPFGLELRDPRFRWVLPDRRQQTVARLEYARYPVPEHVVQQVLSFGSRYGRLRLSAHEDGLLLECDEEALATAT